MLGLFIKGKRDKEIANQIGAEIHSQIAEAFEIDEAGTGERLTKSFTAGYIDTFVSFAFLLYLETENPSYKNHDASQRLRSKYIKHICDGVMPRKLYEIVTRQKTAVELTGSIDTGAVTNSDSKEFVLDTIESFKAGAIISIPSARNLTRFLTSQELKFEEMPLGI